MALPRRSAKFVSDVASRASRRTELARRGGSRQRASEGGRAGAHAGGSRPRTDRAAAAIGRLPTGRRRSGSSCARASSGRRRTGSGSFPPTRGRGADRMRFDLAAEVDPCARGRGLPRPGFSAARRTPSRACAARDRSAPVRDRRHPRGATRHPRRPAMRRGCGADSASGCDGPAHPRTHVGRANSPEKNRREDGSAARLDPARRRLDLPSY